MSQKMQLALALSGLGLLMVEEQRKRRKRFRINRTRWVETRIAQRQTQGVYPNICPKLEVNRASDLRNFAQLFPDQFAKLEQLVTPIIRRQNTNYRDCISVGERLMVTLHFLATGDTFKNLSCHFRMGVSTIRQFVPETCSAIYQVLKDKYMKFPETVEEWKRIADGFLDRWNFPHCLGALDGKHINFGLPPHSGSTYNPKSVILMALVDSSHRFLHVNLESSGTVTGGRIFGGPLLQCSLENRVSNIPPPAPLPASEQLASYHMVADEAFPLKEHVLKPYAKCIRLEEQNLFNNRLLHAQRVVEHAFGVLANHFRVFLTTIGFQDLAKVEKIVVACCALHNLLCTERCDRYMAGIVDQEGHDPDVTPRKWRQDPVLQKNPLLQTADEMAQAEQHRETLCRYFASDRKPEYMKC